MDFFLTSHTPTDVGSGCYFYHGRYDENCWKRKVLIKSRCNFIKYFQPDFFKWKVKLNKYWTLVTYQRVQKDMYVDRGQKTVARWTKRWLRKDLANIKRSKITQPIFEDAKATWPNVFVKISKTQFSIYTS